MPKTWSYSQLSQLWVQISSLQWHKEPSWASCIVSSTDWTTYLSNSFMASWSRRPSNVWCLPVSFDNQNIMVFCPRYQVNRTKYFNQLNLKDILNHGPSYNVISFLKEIGLFENIWYIYISSNRSEFYSIFVITEYWDILCLSTLVV